MAAGTTTTTTVENDDKIETSSSPSSPRRKQQQRQEQEQRSTINVFVDAAVRSGRGRSNEEEDEKKVTLEEILSISSGGPPRFFSPLVEEEEEEEDVVVEKKREKREKKPLMIYLPGLDGTGFSASSQFATLSKEFDLVCLNIPSNDRSDVFEIVDIVRAFIERAKEEHPEREVQLIGESMGGAMSLFVCLKHPELVTRATVVNPASSFDRSVWPSVGPLLPQIPENLYAGLPFALSPVLIDPIRLATEAVELGNLSETLEKMTAMLPALGSLATIIPRDTLKHRLQILADSVCDINENDGEKLKKRASASISRGEYERLAHSFERRSASIAKTHGHKKMQDRNLRRRVARGVARERHGYRSFDETPRLDLEASGGRESIIQRPHVHASERVAN